MGEPPPAHDPTLLSSYHWPHHTTRDLTSTCVDTTPACPGSIHIPLWTTAPWLRDVYTVGAFIFGRKDLGKRAMQAMEAGSCNLCKEFWGPENLQHVGWVPGKVSVGSGWACPLSSHTPLALQGGAQVAETRMVLSKAQSRVPSCLDQGVEQSGSLHFLDEAQKS